MKITCCSKPCVECGFTKNGTKDTLYRETIHMLRTGILFPCHMYLKSKTGSENTGTETLTDEVQVCRGYVSFVKKNMPDILETYRADIQYHWFRLIEEIDDSELTDIYTPAELFEAHKHLRNGTYLNN